MGSLFRTGCRSSLLAALFALSMPASAAASLPKDVQTFLSKREQCDHFRGEESDDPKHAAYISEQLDKYCKGTDAELAALRKKYHRNTRVVRKLKRLENVE